jgi:hypothetical protein
MKKLIVGLTLLLTFMYYNNAQAGFYIDPQVSIQLTEGEIGNTDDITGNGFGSKLGWKTLGLSFGLDYQMMSLDSDNSGTDIDTTEMGIFVGYDLPVMIRFWAVYAFSVTADDAYDGGSGTKFGVGYTGLPLFSINLEMKQYNFDENTSGGDVDVDYTATVFSVSFPFSI